MGSSPASPILSSEKALSVADLFFKYPQYGGMVNSPLFRGLDLSLAQGKITLIMGSPESGKTTLSRILTGLIPRFTGGELSGKLALGRKSLTSLMPYELLEEIGLVFQNSEEQLFTTRCDSEIAFALESLAVAREKIGERVLGALEWLGLSPYEQGNPRNLSGGEKKKLLLACLFALNPAIWLLDETLDEIDSESKLKVLQYLRRSRKTALILSSKWLELYREFVDIFYLLSEGRLYPAGEGKPEPGFWQKLEEQGMLLTEKSSGSSVRAPVPLSGERESTPLIQVRELKFSYQANSGQSRGFALTIPDFSVYKGEIVALAGRNGSGKSTLARVLCGLLAPQSGEILIAKERNQRPAAVAELKSFTGYLFQNPDSQIFLSTVHEELAYGLKHQGRPKPAGKEIDKRVNRAIELFNLPAADLPPAIMSYGTRKRLQAAVYYLLERSLLIIDEGDSGISFRDYLNIVRLLGSTAKGMIIITHNQELARLLAHRIIYLEAGRILPGSEE
ncbi:MAG: ATP-binding cassette domain-containing protein [Spirochaeta sp.]|nr:ATP-binding cassette domain-containing protein [Spirochaeta sp.]